MSYFRKMRKYKTSPSEETEFEAENMEEEEGILCLFCVYKFTEMVIIQQQEMQSKISC